MNTNHRDDLRFFGACSLELGLGFLAILIGLGFGPDPRNRIPPWFHAIEIVQAFGIGAVVGCLLAVAMLALGRLPWQFIQDLNRISSTHLLELLHRFSYPQLVALALCAGAGEELLFRGWLMQWLTGDMTLVSSGQLVFGLLLSSLVFGLAHPMSVVYVILAFLMGIVFGGLYWLTNNLLAPIAAHWIYDAIVMIWMVRSKVVTVTN